MGKSNNRGARKLTGYKSFLKEFTNSRERTAVRNALVTGKEINVKRKTLVRI